MSLWELSAAVDGVNRFHGGESDKPEPMSIARLRQLNPPATMH
jgi:hypothetical protein